MLCARLLHHGRQDEMLGFTGVLAKQYVKLLDKYSVSLYWILEHQPLTLVVAFCSLLLATVLFLVIPKGFFPNQDTGVIQAISEMPQSISFAAMSKHQQALVDVVLQDSAVENVSSFVGIDGVNTTLNSG